MNTPETINIEKYAEALNELIGVDSAYMVGDKSVDAIVELIVAAKKLEKRVKELEEENERIRSVYSHVCVGDVLTQEDIERLRMAHTEQGQHGDPVGDAGVAAIVRCKDCKHYKDWGDCITCMRWTVDWDVPTEPDAFCSYGEPEDKE